MFQHGGNKPSLKGRDHGHVTNFKILHALKYLWRVPEARVVKFCIFVVYIEC